MHLVKKWLMIKKTKTLNVSVVSSCMAIMHGTFTSTKNSREMELSNKIYICTADVFYVILKYLGWEMKVGLWHHVLQICFEY